VALHQLPTARSAFPFALEAIRGARLRSEVSWHEIPAPVKLAPHAFAADGEVVVHGDELSSGRFILLHDPDGQEAWNGTFRVVCFVRAQLEPEFATESMLGDVAWSWVTESLELYDADAHELGATATRVVSQSYGALASRPSSVDVEVRASWTPGTTEDPALPHFAARHLAAWASVMAAAGGLPPLPPDVHAISPVRQARPRPQEPDDD
jgi:hypothetical protein